MAAVNHKFNYFIYLTHTTNTTGFYYILRSYLIMNTRHLVVFMDIMIIKDSGQWQWG